MRCPKCGSGTVPEGVDECPSCGVVFAKLGTAAPPLYVVPPAPAPSFFVRHAVPLVIMCVLGAAVLAFLLWPVKVTRKPPASVQPQAAITAAPAHREPARALGAAAAPVEGGGGRADVEAREAKAAVACGDASDPAVDRAISEGLERLRAGQFEKGVGDIEAVRARLPLCRLHNIDPLLSKAYSALGEQSLKRELWTDAVQKFERAAALAPASAGPRCGLGQVAEKRGDIARARREYREAALLGADEKTVERLYEIAYAGNDLEEAADWLKKLIAMTRGAEREKWVKKASRLGRERPVEEAMQIRADERFEIKYDGRENSEAAYAAQEALVDAFVSLTRELRVKPAGSVTVILYTSRQFYDVTRAPSWAGGLYDGKIRIPVGGVTRNGGPLFRRVVFHELVHVLVRERSRQHVPAWLNEGIAVYYEGLAAGAVNGGGGSWNVKMLRVMEGPFSLLPPKLVPAAYEKSREAVAHIVAQKGENAIGHVLDALARGERLEAALRGVGMQYAE